MYSKYLDAALLLLLSDVTQSAVRFLKTDAVIYMEENVSVWSCTYSIRLTSVLLKKNPPVCTFSWYCISFAIENPRIVSLRTSAEATNKVYQKGQLLQAILLVCDTKYGDKNQ